MSGQSSRELLVDDDDARRPCAIGFLDAAPRDDGNVEGAKVAGIDPLESDEQLAVGAGCDHELFASDAFERQIL